MRLRAVLEEARKPMRVGRARLEAAGHLDHGQLAPRLSGHAALLGRGGGALGEGVASLVGNVVEQALGRRAMFSSDSRSVNEPRRYPI